MGNWRNHINEHVFEPREIRFSQVDPSSRHCTGGNHFLPMFGCGGSSPQGEPLGSKGSAQRFSRDCFVVMDAVVGSGKCKGSIAVAEGISEWFGQTVPKCPKFEGCSSENARAKGVACC